jgi:isoleucyl-tRNA synthetase
VNFIEELTNWYVRLNRTRLKDTGNIEDCKVALSCLYFTLLSMAQLMSPLTPYFTEYQYKQLRKIHPDATNDSIAVDALGRAESVHFTMIPEPDMNLFDETKEQHMKYLQTVLELGRKIRERRNISLKQPVAEILVVTANDAVHEGLSILKNYILEEFNVTELTLSREEDKWASVSVVPNQKVLGKRLGKDFKKVKVAIPKLSSQDIATFMSTGSLTVEGCELSGDDLIVNREFKGDKEKYEADTAPDNSLIVIVDCVETPELKAQGMARELVNRIQKLRKTSGCVVGDQIAAYFDMPGSEELLAAVKANVGLLKKALRLVPLPLSLKPDDAVLLGHEDTEINDVKVAVEICKPSLHFAPDEELAKACGGQDVALVKKFLGTMDYAKLSASTEPLSFALDGTEISLVPGTHFFGTYGEKQTAYPDTVFAWASA